MATTKTYGRLDWMPRLKRWRVILYKGQRDIKMGDYVSKSDAMARIAELKPAGDSGARS